MHYTSLMVRKAATNLNLYLPCCENPAGGGSSAPKTSIRGEERILVVDDEVPLATLIARSLATLGYDATPMFSALEALAALRANPNGYDLIIVDHMMPVMTGSQFASEVRDIRADLPVIIVSGDAVAAMATAGELGNVRAVLAKPYDLQTLGETVRNALGK